MGFFLEAVNFSPKFLGLSVGIFMNFRDCFRTVMAECSGLLSDNPDRIFTTFFRQSQTVLGFGLNLGCNAPFQEGVRYV